MNTTYAEPITGPQRRFLEKLASDREVTAEQLARFDEVASKKAASDLIAEFKALPYKTVKVATKPGYYVQGEDVFHVVLSKVGRPYAKRLESYTDSKGKPKGRWIYAPGEVKNFEELTPLTAAQAGVISKAVGYCCICGRTLTAKASVEASIGPICSGKAF